MDRVIRVKELLKVLGIHRQTLYLWMKSGNFPRPIKLAPKCIGWRESTVEKWLQDREVHST